MYSFILNYLIKNITENSSKILFVPLYYNDDVHMHIINEEDGLDLYNVPSKIDLMRYLEDMNFYYSIETIESKKPMTVEEATLLQIPVNREKDLPGMSYKDSIKRIDKVPHVDIYIEPQLNRGKDKYSSCYVLVKNPKPEDDVNLIPIIIHTSGGVSVHPQFSKYFKRAFTKRERHLILGFLYIYGWSIAWECNLAAEKGKNEIDPFKANWLKLYAMSYKDSDAPKRINQGIPKNSKEYYKASVEDYERWKSSLP